MLKQRRAAAMRVAESLFAAEEAIDAALARAAELTSTLVSARTDAHLSAIVAQDAFEGAAAAVAALARARGDMVETHKRLSEAQVQIGLGAVAIGDLGKPTVAKEDGRRLQIVA
ncbi:MAG: hypothetical protein JOZ90_08925 [Alphaproteobacteria bacterium]|nr:hypothetical protein [Alphaproteobacteria bacterium]MBV9371149.1 hypothetical protein [Alphaproteobacteria bacterium]MBV9901206.1 hypothetical protein [Alphaproteobacteria bacterium]